MRDVLKFPLYLITHPFDGFYSMKHEKMGSTKITVLNIFLFWLVYSINKQYAGFVVNEINPFFLNSLIDLMSIVGFYLLWCVSNWSVTTLTNGEGRFKDITMAISYSFTPMILLFIPATILGRYVAQNEEAFYAMVIGISIVWFLILSFVGTMSVHNYSLLKTIVTIFLTFIAMLIIIFLTLLMFTLIQQVYMFFHSIYTELLYRI